MANRAKKPLLSIVIPTIGRTTLESALLSVRSQFGTRDCQIVLVGDTHADTWTDWLETVPPLAAEYKADYYQLDAGKHNYGSAQCQLGVEVARGQWILLLGDDDEFTDRGLIYVHNVITSLDHPKPVFFKARMKYGSVLWFEKHARLGYVSGQNLCFPNIPEKLGKFDPDLYESDWTFIESTLKLWGDGNVELGEHLAAWSSELIAICH